MIIYKRIGFIGINFTEESLELENTNAYSSDPKATIKK